MANIVQVLNALNLINVSLVVYKVRVCLDSSLNLVEVCAVLKLNVNHAAVNACAEWDSYRKSISNALDGANGYRVSHATARTEVSVTYALWCKNYNNTGRKKYPRKYQTKKEYV